MTKNQKWNRHFLTFGFLVGKYRKFIRYSVHPSIYPKSQILAEQFSFLFGHSDLWGILLCTICALSGQNLQKQMKMTHRQLFDKQYNRKNCRILAWFWYISDIFQGFQSKPSRFYPSIERFITNGSFLFHLFVFIGFPKNFFHLNFLILLLFAIFIQFRPVFWPKVEASAL